MADLLLENCSTESNLETLGQAVLNQATIVRNSLLSQISKVDTSAGLSQLDKINKKYDTQIAPTSNDFVSNQIGLPSSQPSEAEEEARLEPLGLVLIKGILYSIGTDSNIENFRKLFFAVGSNLDLFLQIVRSTEALAVIQTRLIIKKLPPQQTAWTVADARIALSNDAIEDIYQAGDGFYYVVVPQFLSLNKSIAQTALETNVSEKEIVTQVFWLKEIKTDSAHINQLIQYGLSGDERISVLTEQPLKQVRSSVIITTRADIDTAIRKALGQFELLNTRFALIDNSAKEVLRKEIQMSLSDVKDLLLKLQHEVRFNPIVITRPEDIDKFLSLNKKEHLSYLFASKRTVISIDFNISKTDLAVKIKQASSIPAGSSTVPSVLSNSTTATLDADIVSANSSICLNECSLVNMSKKGDLRFIDMNSSYICETAIKTRPAITVVSDVPIIGYADYTSPSSILFRRADIRATLEIDNLFDRIVALAKPISDIVYAAVKVFIELIKQLRNAVDQVLQPLIARVKDLVSQAEAWLSRHASYFGTASLDSSILKCALNLDLQATLPFLDEISPLLEALQKELKNIINQIGQIVSNFLNTMSCLYINFLNDLLKQNTSFLPPFCKTDTFKLPPELDAALLELQQGLTVENVTFTKFSQNLLNVQAEINSIPAKLDSFRESVTCNQTPLNSRFMNVFRMDINASLGTSPLVAASNQISSIVSGASSAVTNASSSLVKTLNPLVEGASKLVPPRG